MDIPNAAFDEPDERDYQYGEMFGDEQENIPSVVDWSKTRLQHQWIERTPSTRMACWSFGMSAIINENSNYDRSWERTKGEELRSRQIKAPYRGSVREGSYMQDNVKQALAEWFIAWYSVVKTVDEFRDSLAKHRLIYTGSKKINWTKTKADSDTIAHIGTGSAHIFAIVGYDDNKRLFKCKNSYGDKLYDKGYFYLRYEDIGALFTAYSIVDGTDPVIGDKRRELVKRIKNK